MSVEPVLHFRGAMGAVIVHHQMQRHRCGKLPMDAAQELQKLLVAVTLIAVADDFAVQHIKRLAYLSSYLRDITLGMPPGRPGQPTAGRFAPALSTAPSRPSDPPGPAGPAPGCPNSPAAPPGRPTRGRSAPFPCA